MTVQRREVGEAGGRGGRGEGRQLYCSPQALFQCEQIRLSSTRGCVWRLGGDTHGGSRRHILRAASAAERWIYGAARVVAAIYLFEVFFVR